MAVKNIFKTMSSEKLDLYTEITAFSREVNSRKIDNEKEFEINIIESEKIVGAKISVIGVGNAGGRIIEHMITENINSNINLIVANTDAQALEASLVPYKIQLGMNETRGLAAGMIPEKGRYAALESYDEIKEILEGSDIVFISAGLGGGTGTGAAPIIATAAKELGALVVAIVTSPFKFEGTKRAKLAKSGLDELKRTSDSIIVVPNERLLHIIEKNLGFQESFRIVDDVFFEAIDSIYKFTLFLSNNDSDIDFTHFKTLMSNGGLSIIGIGYSSGKGAAYDAVKAAIQSPLLDFISIDGAMGVLVHFDINPYYPMIEISEAMGIIEESADENASIIFGTTTNENMDIDEVRIAVFATRLKDITAIEKEEISLLSYFDTINSSSSSSYRKVVGGFNEEEEEILDVPTFLRKQMD